MTSILSAIEQGDPRAAEQLLPLVYDELRKLAVRRLACEKPGQTLQATALVHEAYLRLVGGGASALSWNSRGHFFGAAADPTPPPRRSQPGAGAFGQQLPLHLGQRCHDVEEEAAGRDGGVDAVGQAGELDLAPL